MTTIARPPILVRDVGPGVVVEVSRPIDLVNLVFVEVLGFDCKHRFRGGLIRATGTVTDDLNAKGLTYDLATIDVRIVGYAGGSVVTVYRGSLAGDCGAVEVTLPELAAYSRIAILGRQLIDGGNTALQVIGSGGPHSTMSVHARFLRT